MLTWLQLVPLLGLPTLILSAIAALPTKPFHGHVLGGGPVREYFLNHMLVPVLPNDAAVALVQWFSQANYAQEWFLSLIVIVNINALLLPLLYFVGEFVIKFSTWFKRKDIQLKRDAIRK
jgi:hypothetical protein